MTKGKFIQASLNKCKKMGSKILTHSEECHESCCQWCFWPYGIPSYLDHQEAEKFIPKDVPKGHMVVYVGQNQKRYVVKITLLKHPLFRALLDQARDQYDDSNTPPKLWIPCDETVFLQVLRCSR
uniref:Small auxin-up RNA n=1 Tax=Opuntia streptacantha TaxID=393608 RepID=A0A7C8Z1Z5_OPUST